MAFPGAFEQGEVVGNPVRPDVVALPAPTERIGTGVQPLRLLVVGGSLGAKILNDTLPEALAQVSAPVQVRHQCGKGNGEAVRAAYAAHGIKAEVSDFISDMAAAYGEADLVVCRAGALTVSEVAAAGLGAIFVPLPHAVDDHQTKNAQALVSEGAALLMPQQALTPAALAQQLEQLAGNRERLRDMAGRARQLAITDAAARVADLPARPGDINERLA
ncbi:UDP-N-acetylglucosamine--N-acetylmuramyl-(pentapeptide) pyrophosphoryl-undecaprenol N-acetylglucosamine transferase [Oceanimonas sp. NS1]|nr:UDP-N-acetylglucosamine--N-acetylmuramyl-(pentapeptide) pyrophosphoryl-undecaprenol N-acetylglucosamine transferase [Oceanimonas sp. NS1]